MGIFKEGGVMRYMFEEKTYENVLRLMVERRRELRAQEEKPAQDGIKKAAQIKTEEEL